MNVLWAQTAPLQLEILGKIKIEGKDIKLFRTNERDIIPGMLDDQKIIKVISELGPSEESFVKGHVIYQKFDSDGSMSLRPVFVIESVKPISLKLIGSIGSIQDYQSKHESLIYRKSEYSPLVMPISTEIASTVTLTTAILLMQSLTSSSLQPQSSQQLNSGLIFFAGALAAGAFVVEQYKNETKKQ